MHNINSLLSEFENIASNPRKQLDKILSEGKKAIGVMPYLCPEELVLAAGMVPFGIWGAETQVSEAKRYFPAFICSILQTTLELGIRGAYDGLSAIMIPFACDSLKCMGTNWKYGVKTIPVIDVAYAQNRSSQAGIEFSVSQFKKIAGSLAQIAQREISSEDVKEAILVYNRNRAALRAFSKAAAQHPEAVRPGQRCDVIKAGYFMPRDEHTALVEKLTAALDSLPPAKQDCLRIVTTGIIADSPALLKILAENNMCIADDQIAHESIFFREDTPLTDDPYVGMARRIGNIQGCSILFDPGKNAPLCSPRWQRKRRQTGSSIYRQSSAIPRNSITFRSKRSCTRQAYRC